MPEIGETLGIAAELTEPLPLNKGDNFVSVIVPPSTNPSIPLLVEIVLYSAEISLIQGDNRTILQFRAPNGMAVSIPMDTIGVENLIQALKGTKLSIPRT